jgi:hypothetical protein
MLTKIMESAMHKLTTIWALAVPIFAAGQSGGQVTVISGYVSNRVSVPDITARVGLPLVKTPSVTLDADPFSSGNATFATLTWYGSGAAPQAAEQPAEAQAQPGNLVNLGVATFQNSEGVARLIAKEQVTHRAAGRVYTNQDVAQLARQLNQSTGLVKYMGKTEYLH